jgi:hypothetical protein
MDKRDGASAKHAKQNWVLKGALRSRQPPAGLHRNFLDGWAQRPEQAQRRLLARDRFEKSKRQEEQRKDKDYPRSGSKIVLCPNVTSGDEIGHESFDTQHSAGLKSLLRPVYGEDREGAPEAEKQEQYVGGPDPSGLARKPASQRWDSKDKQHEPVGRERYWPNGKGQWKHERDQQEGDGWGRPYRADARSIVG